MCETRGWLTTKQSAGGPRQYQITPGTSNPNPLYIDILYNDHLVEVKCWKNHTDAIGQAENYARIMLREKGYTIRQVEIHIFDLKPENLECYKVWKADYQGHTITGGKVTWSITCNLEL